jgi:ankyrin repeat protein
MQIQRILEQPNIRDIKTTLDELLGNFKDIIHQALDLILSQIDNLRNLAYTILVWLANTDRPLSVEGLREGLSIFPSVKAFCHMPQLKKKSLSPDENPRVDTNFFMAFSAALAEENGPFRIDGDTAPPAKALLGPLGCCNGLVFQEPGSLNVLLAHDEIKAHLRDYRGKGFKEGDYDQERNNLASACLYYLLLSNFSSGLCETQELYAERLKKNPFFEYAAVCWTAHAQQACKVDVDFLVLRLLGIPKNLASALQVLLLDDMPTGSEEEFKTAYESSRSMTALQVSTRLNLTHIVKRLLKDGDPLHSDSAANTALHEAMNNGNIEAFGLLFNAAMERALRQHDGDLTSNLFLDQVKDRQALLDFYIVKVLQNKSLCHTVKTQDLHGTLAWLAIGKPPSTRNQHGDSLLQLAVTSGSIDLVSTLLRFGASVEDKESTALVQAVRLNLVDIVKMLLERSRSMPPRHPSSVLFQAIKTGNIDITGILLDHGADIDSKVAGGRGVLHEAGASKHAGLVKFLLSQGADACQLDDEQRTPLFDAIESQDVTAIEYLLQNGVDLDAPTIHGRLALHEAAKVGNEEIFMLILNRSLKVNCQDNALKTPMDVAEAEGHTRIVQLLQARGAFSKGYTQSLPDVLKHDDYFPELVRRQTKTWPTDPNKVGFKAWKNDV